MRRTGYGRGLHAVAIAGLSLGLAMATGCHSAFVQATVINGTGGVVHLFEVDYPNASFGSSELAPGAHFAYRFKILGDGVAKVSWTDSAQHDHTLPGPQLKEGEEGDLTITLLPQAKVAWSPHLIHP